MPSRSPASDHDADASPGHDPQVGTGLPAVVAVVPTCGGPDAVTGALEGLAAQEYGNLTVVVLDAESPVDPTERIASVMPDAFVRKVAGGRSFGATCNEVLGTVEGATFLLFLHDDVRLSAGAVHAMVTEAFRANAGVVGPKLLRGDPPELLDEMGFRVDAFGFPVPIVEPGELDQAQHDAARDVFMVSTAAMLIRADLFADLSGFSPAMSPQGEALDLCWRARVAGAHIAVMPAASAVHGRCSPLGDSTAALRRNEIRDQARSLLVTYGATRLIRIAPLAALLSVADLLVSVVSGHLLRAVDILRAWGWNLLHLPSTISLRRRVQRTRRASDAEIRATQLRGSGRIVTSYRNLRSTAGRRIPDALAAARGIPASMRDESVAVGAILAAILLGAFLIGSRGLLVDGVPVVRDFLPGGRSGDLLGEWWTGWRRGGFLVNGATPDVLAVLGLGNIVLLGAGGLARTVMLLAGLPLGVFGAWRLGQGILSPRARVATALAYAFVPVPYDSIGSGRWTSLIAYATAPWVISLLGRMSDLEPFGRRRSARDVVTLGLILAAGATVTLSGLVVAFGIAVVMAAAMLLSGQLGAARRVLRGAALGIGIAAACTLPVVVDLIVRSDRWNLLWGPSSMRRPRLDELLRLSAGGDADTVLWFAVPVVAVLVVLVGRGWRLQWGAICWALAVTAWAGALVVYRLWPTGTRPDTTMLLVPAAAALSFAVGLGLESFGADVRGGAFGWRQAAASLVALVAAVAVVPFVQVAAEGRWGLTDGDVVSAVQTLGGSDDAYRTLWLGDADVLPMRSRRLEETLSFAFTRGVRPTLGSIHPERSTPTGERIAADLRSAMLGGTARLGARLDAAGVRYVVVVTSVSAGSVDPTSAAVQRLRTTLVRQLDLQSLDVAPGIDVYRVGDGKASDLSLRRSPSASVGHVIGNLVALVALAAAVRAWFGHGGFRRTRRAPDSDSTAEGEGASPPDADSADDRDEATAVSEQEAAT